MSDIEMILTLGEKILRGSLIDIREAQSLSRVKKENLLFLMAMADKIRQKFDGNSVDVCSIINARSGRCSENCKYCAQSKYHDTDVEVYPFIEISEIVKKAKESEAHGANRFAIVTSGKGMEGDKEFPKILEAVSAMRKETRLNICCSLGALTNETAKALKNAGVTRYHHNIETSRRNYSSICTTHTYEDRIATIKLAQEAGLEVCSGGILGMNESMQDRIEMAFAIRELNVDSVPLNILNPIKGTVFANKAKMNPWEILKTFALFKFIAPKCQIRTAGGRELNLGDLQSNALLSGLSGIMIGGYLTTGGRSYEDDERMLNVLTKRTEKLSN